MHDETAAKLAYAEATRRISGQMQVLAGVRTRAGTLFGSASLATSFLSAAAAKGQDVQLGAAGWAAVVLFALATVVTAAVFVPTGSIAFSIQHDENLALVDEQTDEMTEADTYRRFTRLIEELYAANTRRMSWYFRAMFALAVLVGLELLLWTFAFLG